MEILSEFQINYYEYTPVDFYKKAAFETELKLLGKIAVPAKFPCVVSDSFKSLAFQQDCANDQRALIEEGDRLGPLFHEA